MKQIGYIRTEKMAPRDGFEYSTTYLKQTLAQRKELCRHIRQVVEEIADAIAVSYTHLTLPTKRIV